MLYFKTKHNHMLSFIAYVTITEVAIEANRFMIIIICWSMNSSHMCSAYMVSQLGSIDAIFFTSAPSGNYRVYSQRLIGTKEISTKMKVTPLWGETINFAKKHHFHCSVHLCLDHCHWLQTVHHHHLPPKECAPAPYYKLQLCH